jgi:hypothetical protein
MGHPDEVVGKKQPPIIVIDTDHIVSTESRFIGNQIWARHLWGYDPKR